MFGRNKIAAIVAEFLGTGILTLLILSVQRSTIGVPFFVALTAGLTVTVLYFALGNVSGGYFNPAVTIAMATARKIEVLKAVIYVAVQLLGAWLAYWLYTYYANNTLMPIGGHFTWKVLVSEGVGASILGFAYAAAAYQGYTTAVRASVAGIGYVVAVVAASAAAIGLVNPAVALGVRAWIWGSYVAGPVVGAFVGVNLYKYVFAGVSQVAPPVMVAAVAAPKATATRKSAPAKTAARKTTKKPAAKRASK